MIDSMKKLFVEQIKDLYHAEKQLGEALPRMSRGATSPELKDRLNRHADETKDQVKRLEEVFKIIGEKPAQRKCKAMVGLIAESDDVIDECDSPEVRDAAIISSAQRIQHYEIAGYGTARTFAEMLGENDAARILQQTLDEETKTDGLLTDLATNTVNRQAVHA